MPALTSLLALLLEDAPPATGSSDGGSGSPLMQMLPMFLMILAVFYFIAWRPQAKERKAREAMLSAVKKGDRVMMNSGLFGTIAAVSEKDVTLKVDDKGNVRLRFARFAIQRVLDGDEPVTEEPRS